MLWTEVLAKSNLRKYITIGSVLIVAISSADALARGGYRNYSSTPEWAIAFILFVVACGLILFAISIWTNPSVNVLLRLLLAGVSVVASMYLHYQAFLIYQETLFGLVLFVAVLAAVMAVPTMFVFAIRKIINMLQGWFR